MDYLNPYTWSEYADKVKEFFISLEPKKAVSLFVDKAHQAYLKLGQTDDLLQTSDYMIRDSLNLINAMPQGVDKTTAINNMWDTLIPRNQSLHGQHSLWKGEFQKIKDFINLEWSSIVSILNIQGENPPLLGQLSTIIGSILVLSAIIAYIYVTHANASAHATDTVAYNNYLKGLQGVISNPASTPEQVSQAIDKITTARPPVSAPAPSLLQDLTATFKGGSILLAVGIAAWLALNFLPISKKGVKA